MNVGALVERAMAELGEEFVRMGEIVARATMLCSNEIVPTHIQIRAAVRHLVTRGLAEATRVDVGGREWEWRYAWLGARRPWTPLTERQREVAILMVSDLTREEIGTALGVSRRTIDTHRAGVLGVFGCKSALALYRLASERGWLAVMARCPGCGDSGDVAHITACTARGDVGFAARKVR